VKLFLLCFLVFSFSVKMVPAFAQTEKKPAESDSSDYEVDYEEEPGTEEVEEPKEEKPVKKSKGGSMDKGSKDTTSQGSRAEKKIAPMMKSETKSVYKKNGKALDVDTD